MTVPFRLTTRSDLKVFSVSEDFIHALFHMIRVLLKLDLRLEFTDLLMEAGDSCCQAPLSHNWSAGQQGDITWKSAKPSQQCCNVSISLLLWTGCHYASNVGLVLWYLDKNSMVEAKVTTECFCPNTKVLPQQHYVIMSLLDYIGSDIDTPLSISWPSYLLPVRLPIHCGYQEGLGNCISIHFSHVRVPYTWLALH